MCHKSFSESGKDIIIKRCNDFITLKNENDAVKELLATLGWYLECEHMLQAVSQKWFATEMCDEFENIYYSHFYILQLAFDKLQKKFDEVCSCK